MTLIRHAGIASPQSVTALAHPVQPSARVRPLVAAIGGTALLLPGPTSARFAAVALPTVAMPADAKDSPTAATATDSEDNLGHDNSSSPITLHEMTDDGEPAAPMMMLGVPTPADGLVGHSWLALKYVGCKRLSRTDS